MTAQQQAEVEFYLDRDRREYLAGVKRNRGKEACEALKLEIKRQWEMRK